MGIDKIKYYKSDTDETLEVLGIKFEAIRECQDGTYGPYSYYINGKAVHYWRYDIMTGNIEIIEKQFKLR